MFQNDLHELLFHCALDLRDVGKNGAASSVLDVHVSEEQKIEASLLVDVIGSNS